MPGLSAPALLGLPEWLPDRVRLYLSHTEDGVSIRALARKAGLNASTVMRQVRRFEMRRDDPLMDEALASLSRESQPLPDPDRPDPDRPDPDRKDAQSMTAPIRVVSQMTDEATLLNEGRRILRRLAEPGAVLAIATDMEKAVVMREFPDGRSARTGVVERAVAQAFTLKDWIHCRKTGRVSTYEITQAGRSALKRMIDDEDRRRHDTMTEGQGMAEAPGRFAGQHRIWGERQVMDDDGPRRLRYNLAESPVSVLGRRRDKDGKPFLETGLIEAAERLREDFELAQMGPRVAQNWERFLTGGDRGGFRPDNGIAEGPGRARERVAGALRDLGPGLGDVALRVCCFLEGIETAERRMGWAARSGKIVLRIALMRLRRHYDETYGKSGPLIG
ncbi:MAG: helix-turn-helix domain-containing protein [Rhodobacter sp.]|nr:helix-turn-helix domain-containing protein [Rhodobacter sp.]